MRFAILASQAVASTIPTDDQIRRDPLVEAAVVISVAPFLGAGFDIELLGVTPLTKETFFKEGMNPQEIRRTAPWPGRPGVGNIWDPVSSRLITQAGSATAW